MTTERPLPSRSDFEALRTQNAMYVDKTDWVHELAAGTSDRLFLARPPRRVMRSCLTRSLEASPVVLVLGLDKATQQYATVEQISRAFPIHVEHMGGVKRDRPS